MELQIKPIQFQNQHHQVDLPAVVVVEVLAHAPVHVQDVPVLALEVVVNGFFFLAKRIYKAKI
jgi:hypothetical protein